MHNTLMPASLTSNAQETVQLPLELIDDLLCLALTVWTSDKSSPPQDRQHAVNTLLTVVSPSNQFLRIAIGRFSFADVDSACLQGNLPKLQAIFKYGYQVDAGANNRCEEAAQSLSYAACGGHVNILEWWFAAAVFVENGDGTAGAVPPLPNRVALLSQVAESVSKLSQDETMTSLQWLKARGYLPTLKDLDDGEDAPGYDNLFYDVYNASCMQVLHFLLETYGVTDEIELNDALVSTAASEGDTGLLRFLAHHYQTNGPSSDSRNDGLDFHAAVLPDASYTGRLHVLEWWSDCVCTNPQLTEGIFQQMVADSKLWMLDLSPPVLLAHVLQERFGSIAGSLSKASQGGQICVLNWFRDNGMMGCVKGPSREWFTRIIDNAVWCTYLSVLDWWLDVKVEGLDKRVSYSVFKGRAGDNAAFRDWWRRAGLKPEMPPEADATKVAINDLFSDPQGYVVFATPSKTPSPIPESSTEDA